MTADEFSTEMELYGVSPTIIAYIMIAITLIIPLGYISGFIGIIFTNHAGPMVYSFFWEVIQSTLSHRLYFYLVSPLEILKMIPITFLHWLFAYWMVRYYQGKSSRFAVEMIGFLSILLPFIWSLIWSVLGGGPVDIIVPLPLQFIMGLLILRRIEGPEVISPWSGVRIDFSWWKWRRAKRKSSEEPVEKEEKKVKTEDWLEE